MFTKRYSGQDYFLYEPKYLEHIHPRFRVEYSLQKYLILQQINEHLIIYACDILKFYMY